jgi:argininosuccinate synthase
LGSTIAAHRLIHHEGYEVISLSANLGQSGELAALGEYAIELGASAAHVVDARERFLAEYCLPSLQAQVRTRAGSLMGRQLAHEVIAEEAVQLAAEHGCTYVAYGGSTGTRRGEGPKRFATALRALAPEIRILLPATRLHLVSRRQFLEYAEKHELRPWHDDPRFSADETCWGRSVSLGGDWSPSDPPPPEAFKVTVNPQDAPDDGRRIELGFEAGVPVLLDGIRLPLLQIVNTLNEIAGRHGVGRLDVIEHGTSGRRFREVHEAPAATVLHAAHRALQQVTLSHDQLHVNEQLARSYGRLIQHGAWRQRARRSLDAYFEHARQLINGSVRCRLLKGTCTVVGRAARADSEAPLAAAVLEEDLD